jgi:hypothetical protein
MNLEIRKLMKTLVKSGALSVATATYWTAMFRGRIIGVEMTLNNLGATSGATQIDVALNGSSILAANLSLAFNASSHSVKTTNFPGAVGGVQGLSGVPFQEGDIFSIPVAAIPGTTSQDLIVDLFCAVLEV